MRAVLILFVVATSAARADPYSIKAAGEEAKTWQGKSVVLTARPMSRFMSWSAAKISLGLFGGSVAAVAGGKQIVDQNGIENPAPYLGKALFEAAQSHFGVVSSSLAPLSLDSTDPAAIAHAGHGADLVFDVQPLRASLEPLVTQKGRYFVTSDVIFRVIDVASGRMVGEKTCVRTTQVNPTLPTKDELLADHAALLRAALNAQRDSCLASFEMDVLGVPPGP